VNIVPLDELSRLRQAYGRNRLIVFDDQLNRAAGRAIADLIEVQEKAVQDVAAVLRIRTR
jgi:hypothetical protein